MGYFPKTCKRDYWTFLNSKEYDEMVLVQDYFVLWYKENWCSRELVNEAFFLSKFPVLLQEAIEVTTIIITTTIINTIIECLPCVRHHFKIFTYSHSFNLHIPHITGTLLSFSFYSWRHRDSEKATAEGYTASKWQGQFLKPAHSRVSM